MELVDIMSFPAMEAIENLHKLCSFEFLYGKKNDSVTEDLDHLKYWLESNKLSLNIAKTQSVLIGSRNRLKNMGMFETQRQP